LHEVDEACAMLNDAHFSQISQIFGILKLGEAIQCSLQQFLTGMLVWLAEAEVSARDMTHEERREREKPTKTLFIRNVPYEATQQELSDIFSAYGKVSRVYDLIAKRGMAFVTYVRTFSVFALYFGLFALPFKCFPPPIHLTSILDHCSRTPFSSSSRNMLPISGNTFRSRVKFL
jgi:hypothetical protein